MRIDKLLWFLRLVKTRALAQAMAQAGHIRLNGRRVDRAHQRVVAGDVLVLPAASGVRIIEILGIPSRRGPAPEARGCYRALDVRSFSPIAAAADSTAAEGTLQP